MRHNVAVMLAGKVLGLGILLALMVTFLPNFAHAQGTGPDATAQINAINTVWVMVAAFLVFCMQAGFVMLEAGFARQRESVNILVEGIADTFICGILFWAWGFAFMFEPGTPLIGTTGFFMMGLDPTYGSTGVPLLAFWVFQFAFADTCSMITSGAMIGRCGFIGDILYSIGVTGFIYPIIGHWSWGLDGWLAAMRFRDFAGSMAATLGGTLVVAFVLMYAVKAIGTLRVSAEGELEGLDLHEHGASAYPEYALVPAPSTSSAHPGTVPAPTFAPARRPT